jgi:hypothetical protein
MLVVVASVGVGQQAGEWRAVVVRLACPCASARVVKCTHSAVKEWIRCA